MPELHQILERVQAVKTTAFYENDDMVPVCLVERKGETIAALNLLNERDQCLNMLQLVGAMFSPDAMTICQDALFRTPVEGKPLPNETAAEWRSRFTKEKLSDYEQGDFAKQKEAGDIDVQEAVVVTRVVRMDGEIFHDVAMLPYAAVGRELFWDTPNFKGDSDYSGIWIDALKEAIAQESAFDVMRRAVTKPLDQFALDGLKRDGQDRVSASVIEDRFPVVVKLLQEKDRSL